MRRSGTVKGVWGRVGRVGRVGLVGLKKDTVSPAYSSQILEFIGLFQFLNVNSQGPMALPPPCLPGLACPLPGLPCLPSPAQAESRQCLGSMLARRRW